MWSRAPTRRSAGSRMHGPRVRSAAAGRTSSRGGRRMAAAHSRCAAHSCACAPLRRPSSALLFPLNPAAALSCRASLHPAAHAAAFRSLHAAIAGAAAASWGLRSGPSMTCSNLPTVRDTAPHCELDLVT